MSVLLLLLLLLLLLSHVRKHPARRPRPGDGGFFSLLLELILLGVAT
jgi:hypothetical protein